MGNKRGVLDKRRVHLAHWQSIRTDLQLEPSQEAVDKNIEVMVDKHILEEVVDNIIATQERYIKNENDDAISYLHYPHCHLVYECACYPHAYAGLLSFIYHVYFQPSQEHFEAFILF